MTTDSQAYFHVRATSPGGATATFVLRLPAGAATTDAVNQVLEAHADPALRVEAVLLGTGKPMVRVPGSGRAFHATAQAASYARGLATGYAAQQLPLGDFQDLGAADAERRAEALAERRRAQHEAAWER